MIFQQIFDLIYAQIFTIPIDNALGALYTFFNIVALFLVQLFTGGEFTLPSLF